MMDVYKITRVDPRKPGREKAQYGPAARARSIARQVAEVNAGRAQSLAWCLDDTDSRGHYLDQHGPEWWEPVELRVDRLIITAYEDATGHFVTH
jgi:hypothetical protein